LFTVISLYSVGSLAKFFRRFSFLSPNVVGYTAHTRLSGAIGATEKVFFCLDAVTDNFAAAIGADGCKPMNRAFETIENVAVSRCYYFKRQIIIVAANFALSHFPTTPYFILL
jgi:hypothetical protein